MLLLVILIEVTMSIHCSPGEALWVGLRFRNGAEWIWDNGSNEAVTWGSKCIHEHVIKYFEILNDMSLYFLLLFNDKSLFTKTNPLNRYIYLFKIQYMGKSIKPDKIKIKYHSKYMF